MAVCLLCVGCVLAVGAARAWKRSSWPFRSAAPAAVAQAADAARAEPLSVGPTVGGLMPMTSDEIEWLHRQMQPHAREQTNMSVCFHLLHVHGVEAKFDEGALRSGREMLEVLTSQQKGEALFGRSPIVRTRNGVRFPTGPGLASALNPSLEAHRDQCLAVLAELGLPLSYPLTVDGRPVPLREALRDSIANFHLEQKELAWTALAYGLYLPPTREWENRFGERYSFDGLVDELLRRPLSESACGGMHIVQTLTVLARVHRGVPILSQPVYARLTDRLRRWVDLAVHTQQPDGCWLIDWSWPSPADATPQRLSADTQSPKTRLLATGHVAEWMLHLPEDLQVSEEVLRPAAGWLYEQLKTADRAALVRDFCPYSHAATVLRHLAFVFGEEVSSVPADRGG